MHKAIAKFFSTIVATIHAVVFLGWLSIMVAGILNIPGNQITSGEPVLFLLYGSGFLVVYLLFAFTLSTLIRANQNLERLADAAERHPGSVLPQPGRGPDRSSEVLGPAGRSASGASSTRREPSLGRGPRASTE